jgi:tRNA pseudouridine32 synthase/23S rRNA pseudouridine746 synthase
MEELLELPRERAEVPERFPSPFDESGPHVLARDAALELQRELRSGFVSPGVSTEVLRRPEGGKMFGVLVVRAPDGRLGWLKAFSGQMDGAWTLPGYVPPLFDAEARARVEPVAERRVKELSGLLEALDKSQERVDARRRVEEAERHWDSERRTLRARHQERKARRHATRAALSEGEAPIGPVDAALRREELDEESRRDDVERRRLDARAKEALRVERVALKRLERRLGALRRLRAFTSRRAMQHIHDTYRPLSADGRTTSLRALFAPLEPSWGTGDCAAPKLLGFAHKQGLTPIALAEFWWGPPPPGGGRVEGEFYPACRVKCGPLIPFMLEGMEVAVPRVRSQPVELLEPSVVYEDARYVVVNKPHGLLSVPGKDLSQAHVLGWLRAKYPRATGPLLVHRLDQDTSGLLLAALDEEAHRFLQAQFIARSVEKRYVAVLDGVPGEQRGTVRLALRVDLEQRPRQLVDTVHGRAAVTEWEVLERVDGRARVALFPKSGRTHQLRVHAAHPSGIGVPILGDPLYGRRGERLYLHSEVLGFQAPDGAWRTVRAEAPF